MTTPRERVIAALEHREPDRVPLFEVWLDNDELIAKVGGGDLQRTHVELGLDSILMPYETPPGSKAWRDGVDEWGRVWQKGWYAGGVVESEADLAKYSPSMEYLDRHFDAARTAEVRELYPDHCLMYGSHVGPFTAAYLAMGMERFFAALHRRPDFVQKLLANRTEYCVAMLARATRLGAEVLILGEDAAHSGGPMISPEMWREFILPLHRRIVAEAGVPILWHSDGDVTRLLPMAVEAGFAGMHSLEPDSGVDLARVKQDFGQDLVLVGNVEASVLCQDDPEPVRREVKRCISQGAPGGGYMFSTCSSIFKGMNLEAVIEMYRYAAEIGVYRPT
jgi:uroporphyrinogen-III decarboxylase